MVPDRQKVWTDDTKTKLGEGGGGDLQHLPDSHVFSIGMETLILTHKLCVQN